MLRPTKSTNLNLAVPRVAALILKMMNRQQNLSYNTLVEKLCAKLGDDVRYVFLPSVWFLYLMGTIEYFPKTDSFLLRNNHEAK